MNWPRKREEQSSPGGNRVVLEGDLADGYYIEPTIIEGLPFDCRTNQEEIFGPVVTIAPFKTENEVLKYANSTTYGLASCIWTENLTKAHRLAASLETGNCMDKLLVSARLKNSFWGC